MLGGGIVEGALVLVGGDPGIGKSTLLLQMCHHLSRSGKKVLYVTGEESARQIRLRAGRLGAENSDMLVLAEVMARRCGGKKPILVASGPLAIPAAHAWAADSSSWSGVEVRDAPASWRDCAEGGAARLEYTRYADVVPTAYIEYDWIDLLPSATALPLDR